MKIVDIIDYCFNNNVMVMGVLIGLKDFDEFFGGL